LAAHEPRSNADDATLTQDIDRCRRSKAVEGIQQYPPAFRPLQRLDRGNRRRMVLKGQCLDVLGQGRLDRTLQPRRDAHDLAHQAKESLRDRMRLGVRRVTDQGAYTGVDSLMRGLEASQHIVSRL